MLLKWDEARVSGQTRWCYGHGGAARHDHDLLRWHRKASDLYHLTRRDWVHNKGPYKLRNRTSACTSGHRDWQFYKFENVIMKNISESSWPLDTPRPMWMMSSLWLSVGNLCRIIQINPHLSSTNPNRCCQVSQIKSFNECVCVPIKLVKKKTRTDCQFSV